MRVLLSKSEYHSNTLSVFPSLHIHIWSNNKLTHLSYPWDAVTLEEMGETESTAPYSYITHPYGTGELLPTYQLMSFIAGVLWPDDPPKTVQPPRPGHQ